MNQYIPGQTPGWDKDIPLARIQVGAVGVVPSRVLELAQDIRKNGLLSPLLVTPVKPGDDYALVAGFRYKLIAGFRRFAAIRQLGWTDVRCKVLSNEEAENPQTLDLPPSSYPEAVPCAHCGEALEDDGRCFAEMQDQLAGILGKMLKTLTDPEWSLLYDRVGNDDPAEDSSVHVMLFDFLKADRPL